MPTKGIRTPRQQAFIEAAAKPMTGKEAAIQAGYSPRSAKIQASKLLAKPEIAAEVRDLRTEAQRAAEVDVVETWRALQEYALDRAPNVRPGAIQAAREILRGAQEVGAEIEVDARTLVTQNVAPYLALNAQESRAFAAWVLEQPTPKSLETAVMEWRYGTWIGAIETTAS